MAKKATAKKTVKKAAKKATKKSAPKKAAKKTAKKAAPKKAAKAAKKSAPKKAAKKSAPKKAVKKAAKKAVKTAKKVVKAAKKAAPKKSAAKKAIKKAVKTVKKAVAPAKKAVAKKVAAVKKSAPAKNAVKTVKKAVRKAAPKTMVQKVQTAIGNVTHNVTDFVKEKVSNVIEKITPDRTSDDAPAYERPSNDDSSSNDDSNDNRSNDSEDAKEEEGGSDDEEDRRPFVKYHTHLKEGDKAPWFEGTDQNGRSINSDSFPGKTIVLYFYPKDDTPGCTATACSLRDEQQFLSNRDYAIVGVSADDEKSHAKFAAKYELPLPLLADTDMTVIKAFDVWGRKMLAGRIYDGIIRTTFVIGPTGYISHVIDDVDTENHAQQILEMEE